MKKLSSLTMMVFASSFLMTGSLSADVSSNTTSAQSISATGTLTIDSNISVTVSGSATAITFADSHGNTPSPDSVGLNTDAGATVSQTGTGIAITDSQGHQNITINNGLNATISAAGNEAIELTHASNNVVINNTGTITATGAKNQAVDLVGITTGTSLIANFSTGSILTTGADAVRPGMNGTVENSGTIKSTDTTPGNSTDGIDLQTSNNVTIINDDADTGTGGASLIQGARHGITGGNTAGTAFSMSITNNLNGTISGKNGSGINIDGASLDGFTINESVTVKNLGLIEGDGVTGDGDGVDVDGLVNLTNGSATNATATIKSISSLNDTSEGVTVGGGTIQNYGLIEGSVDPATLPTGNTAVGRGITLAGVDKSGSSPIPIQGIYGTTSVTNFSTGKIVGDSDAGIAIEGHSVLNDTPYIVTITNAGLIRGNSTGTGNNVAAIEADLTAVGVAPNNINIIDTGTITDTFSNKAIDFGSGTNTLTVNGGLASIVGDINGGPGSTTISIDPGAGNAFSYAGAISNVAGLENKSGTVTFTGASTYAGPTKISGGTTYVNNTAGSGTGSSNVEVVNGASFGGKGIVQPGVGNAVKLDNGGTLISGVIPVSGTVAGGGLTLDNSVAKGIVLDASAGNATLTFLLGSGPSGSFNFSNPDTNSSFMTVIGNTTGELKFVSGDFVNLDDLTGGHLQLVMSSPYLLISTTAGNNSDFAGLTTTGGTTNGIANNGYVTNLSLEGLNPAIYPNARLFLDNGNLEVVPEPSTWAMMVGGLLTLIVLRFRRRLKR